MKNPAANLPLLTKRFQVYGETRVRSLQMLGESEEMRNGMRGRGGGEIKFKWVTGL